MVQRVATVAFEGIEARLARRETLRADSLRQSR